MLLPQISQLIIFIKQCYGLHSGEKLLEQVAFVRGVYGIAFKAESHKERVDPEDTLKVGKDRNRSASA